MSTTKAGSSELHSTPTELQFMRIATTDCVKYSAVSMAIRQYVGLSPETKSMFVKLCELPEYTKISQETHKLKNMVSGVSQHRKTTHSISIPESMWKTDIFKDYEQELLKNCCRCGLTEKEFKKLYLCEFKCEESKEE